MVVHDQEECCQRTGQLQTGVQVVGRAHAVPHQMLTDDMLRQRQSG